MLAALACYPSCHFTYNVVEWFSQVIVVFQANQKSVSVIIVTSSNSNPNQDGRAKNLPFQFLHGNFYKHKN